LAEPEGGEEEDAPARDESAQLLRRLSAAVETQNRALLSAIGQDHEAVEPGGLADGISGGGGSVRSTMRRLKYRQSLRDAPGY